MGEPLRYNITDWHQLRQVVSNNSRELRIVVSDIIQQDILTGLRIQIYHSLFGPLFACVLNAQGSLITDGSDVDDFSTERILQELAKYGFFVTYEQATVLPADQLTFLATIQNLGYDKLRILPVKSGDVVHKYLVVFNVAKAANWLNNMHIASYSEYTTVLQRGGAVNITDNAKQWSWEWLDFVANIEDILEQNKYSG